MITERQYLDALSIVREYLDQINKEVLAKDVFLDSIIEHNKKISNRACIAIRKACYLSNESDNKPPFYNYDSQMTFRNLQDKGLKWLLRQRGVGYKTIMEIKNLYEDNGFYLK